MKRKLPTTGLWWVILDDGTYYTIDPVVVRVIVHDDNSLDAEWVDQSMKSFAMDTREQEIVRLTQTVFYGTIWSEKRGEYRVTWLAPVVPPRNAPARLDPVPASMAI